MILSLFLPLLPLMSMSCLPISTSHKQLDLANAESGYPSMQKIPPSRAAPSFKLTLPHQVVHQYLLHLVDNDLELAGSPDAEQTWHGSIAPRRNKERGEFTLQVLMMHTYWRGKGGGRGVPRETRGSWQGGGVRAMGIQDLTRRQMVMALFPVTFSMSICSFLFSFSEIHPPLSP